MTPDQMHRTLIKTCKLFGLTTRETSTLTGYPYSTVRRWYKHSRVMKSYELYDLADALDFDIVLRKRKKIEDAE